MTLLYAAALWLAAHWSFVAIMSAKAARDRGELSRYWTAVLLPLAVIGLVCDVLFNLTFGTLLYAELPRELLFTSRCNRHIKGVGRRYRMAAFWAKQLNQFDPLHIHAQDD